MVVINPSAASVKGIDFYSKEFGSYAPELVVTYYDENTTSVETIQYSSTKIYPNPTTGIVNINLSEYSSLGSQFTVSLYNMQGVKVKEIQSVKADLVQFDISSLENGAYNILIKQDDKQFYQKVLKL